MSNFRIIPVFDVSFAFIVALLIPPTCEDSRQDGQSITKWITFAGVDDNFHVIARS